MEKTFEERLAELIVLALAAGKRRASIIAALALKMQDLEKEAAAEEE